MAMLVFAAILGALLGLTLRPPLLAVALAMMIAGGLQAGLALIGRLAAHTTGRELLARRIDALIGNDVHALWPVLAAAGVGSICSAVLWSWATRQSTDHYWFRAIGARQTFGFKAMDMVDDRDIHTAAEARFRDIMDR